MTGGLSKSGMVTGFAFSGGKTTAPLAAADLTEVEDADGGSLVVKELPAGGAEVEAATGTIGGLGLGSGVGLVVCARVTENTKSTKLVRISQRLKATGRKPGNFTDTPITYQIKISTIAY